MTPSPVRVAHPILIFEGALWLINHVKTSAVIPEHERERWYSRVMEATELLMGGMQPEVNEDGTYFFPSKPGSKRLEGERRGHHVKNRTCDCMASEHGIPCWARAAREICAYVAKYEPIPVTYEEELFAEEMPA